MGKHEGESVRGFRGYDKLWVGMRMKRDGSVRGGEGEAAHRWIYVANRLQNCDQ